MCIHICIYMFFIKLIILIYTLHSNCHDLTFTSRIMLYWRIYFLFQYNLEVLLLSALAGNGMVFHILSLTVVFLSTLKLREKD